MIYGLEQNIFQSPISLSLSLILLLGVSYFGTFIQRFFIRKLKLIGLKENILFSPIIGIYCLLYPLYLILILEFKATFFIKFTAYILIILGVFQIFNFKKDFLKIYNSYFVNKNSQLVITILIILLFLISSSPITHADAVDYHFLGALNLLNFGHFHKEILPMHLNLVSIGEIIISLGLAVKAEQFSSIVQTISLLSLIPLFNKKKNIFLILILICPITLFLVSSTKPQLIFCISALIIFAFLNNFYNKFSNRQLKILFPITMMILSINILAKYSFVLSSTLLGSYFLYIMYKKRLLIFSIFTLLIIFSITFIPFWVFRFENFDTTFFEIVQSPLPINIYGYESLNNLLKGGSISVLGVFFPKDLSSFSTTFGPLILFFPFLYSKKIFNYKIELSIIFVFFSFVFIFGSNLPRFLFEGFLWLSYLISKNVDLKSYFLRLFHKLVYLQILIIIPIYLYFIITIFPGSVIESSKNKILSRTVNGFELAKWTNESLNKDDILLSTHRSVSLFKNKTYSNIYTWHTKPENNGSFIYYNFLKKEKVNRILFYGTKLDKQIYKDCLGKELYFKKNVGRYVGRNPFNRKEFYYDGWIFELNYEKLPNCLIR